jgi:ornithine cyclodeaminase/alanine dehydrogenase-like protein (mu-crystallin family)
VTTEILFVSGDDVDLLELPDAEVLEAVETALRAHGDGDVGRKPGRERPDERIVFWHRGFAISDVMLGNLIYERAVAAGVGSRLVLQSAAEEL